MSVALFARCEECRTETKAEELPSTLWCCPACGFHLPMPARERLRLIADPHSLGDDLAAVKGTDPLAFVDSRPYPERLSEARLRTGESEAFVATRATIGDVPSLIGVLDFAFMGGTLSPAVGERIARVFELGVEERRAIVLCTASGGARMQEGTLSLFQMMKTTAARVRFRDSGLPYLTVFCHPTLGGVAASFASQADLCLAEPRARIGFAGPRVIEELTGTKLPAEFQRAEFVEERGFIDRIVPRSALRSELVRLVRLLSGRPS